MAITFAEFRDRRKIFDIEAYTRQPIKAETIPGLEPPQILQVQRILLEGFTNVIKHAKASRVVMQARWQTAPTPTVVLRLIDNGVGLSAPALGLPGLGLPSMQARAQALGATLTLSPGDEGGAILSIVWPMA